MDFQIRDEQMQLLDSVEKFAKLRLNPIEVQRRDENHIAPYDLLRDFASMGLLALPFDQQFGGLEESWMTLSLVQEKLAEYAYFASSILSRVVAFGGMSLVNFGTPQQKADLLPELIEGRALFALALSEPGVGSDVSGIQTRAVRVHGGWSIIGRKTWISDADQSTHLIVPAKTLAETGNPEGISVFLVPRDAAGISMTSINKVGNHCMPSFDIGFDEVNVDSDALMGLQGHGLRHILSTLHYSRASMAAAATGTAQSAVNLTVHHAKSREQFGRPIGSNQAIAHLVADMQMRVDQARLTTRHLSWLISEGLPCKREGAQAKVVATEALEFVSNAGMQVLASAGYAADSEMQRIWRDARLYTFGEGSNQIQRNMIAREMGLM